TGSRPPVILQRIILPTYCLTLTRLKRMKPAALPELVTGYSLGLTAIQRRKVRWRGLTTRWRIPN
ncbi:MAG: hypothetical protein AAF483_15195, partial [Planctomycetota bacterium]